MTELLVRRPNPVAAAALMLGRKVTRAAASLVDRLIEPLDGAFGAGARDALIDQRDSATVDADGDAFCGVADRLFRGQTRDVSKHVAPVELDVSEAESCLHLDEVPVVVLLEPSSIGAPPAVTDDLDRAARDVDGDVRLRCQLADRITIMQDEDPMPEVAGVISTEDLDGARQ